MIYMQTFRCSDHARTTDDVGVGGQEFETEEDDDGLIDCPEGGMWFWSDEPDSDRRSTMNHICHGIATSLSPQISKHSELIGRQIDHAVYLRSRSASGSPGSLR